MQKISFSFATYDTAVLCFFKQTLLTPGKPCYYALSTIFKLTPAVLYVGELSYLIWWPHKFYGVMNCLFCLADVRDNVELGLYNCFCKQLLYCTIVQSQTYQPGVHYTDFFKAFTLN